jgi:hypothetical protein
MAKNKREQKGKKAPTKAAKKTRVKVHEPEPAKGKPPAKPGVKVHEQSLEDLKAAGRISSGPIPIAPPKPAPAAATVATKGQQPPADSGGFIPTLPIGPGNPPRSGLIKPGEVRNPNGYPKGRPNAKTVIKYWLGQEVVQLNPISEQNETMTVLDTMTLGLINQARKGSISAYRELLDRIEGKPVQSTKLLNAEDQLLKISVGFSAPTPPEKPKDPGEKEGQP